MTYIKRHIDNSLAEWKNSVNHKPLLLRGARQVGKSSSVREFGKQFEFFLEINFEKIQHAKAKPVFERSSSPQSICSELSLLYDMPIIPNRTLLFLDEIQSCIPAISALRFFYEEMPELHIIAAGSLLEFALEELPSFGVGRITSRFMYPMSFDEFMRAINRNMLADAVRKATPEKPLSESLHKTCLQEFIKFVLIGGLPEVVATYANGGTLRDCMLILDDLISTYTDDFVKYKTKISPILLRRTLKSIAEQTGSKFNYSAISHEERHETLKQSVELLVLAGLAYPQYLSNGNGIPLGAESNTKFRKFLIFDTGIMLRVLGGDISDILFGETLEQVNKGNVAELFVGLEFVKNARTVFANELYYWQRMERNSRSRVDFLIQKNNKIIPVDVKSGTTGKMQSLNVFMKEKKSEPGIRTSLENFGQLPKIEIYPLYAISNLLN
jgi:predicted AAA+ superfamily ATPase